MEGLRRVILNRKYNVYQNTEYLSQVMFLYMRYEKFLDDDYAKNGSTFYEYFIDLVERTSPFFWIFLDGQTVTGFVYLEKIIGDNNNLHSGELSVCFDKAYWGEYTKNVAKLFIKHCFDIYGFKKIKALIYPENHRAKAILCSSGFEKEGYLRSETLRNGRLQDIELYAVINNKKKGKI